MPCSFESVPVNVTVLSAGSNSPSLVKSPLTVIPVFAVNFPPVFIILFFVSSSLLSVISPFIVKLLVTINAASDEIVLVLRIVKL